MNARSKRTLSDLAQDGLVIGQKLQRLYPDCKPSNGKPTQFVLRPLEY